MGSATLTPIRIEYDDDAHKYAIDGIPVPSVTTILDETDPKPALPWWGMRVGMAAVVELVQLGIVTWPALQAMETPRAIYDRTHPDHAAAKLVIERHAITARLTTNHVKDDAGARGTSIHVAADRLGAGLRVGLDDFPVEHQGFVSALYGYWMEQEPDVREQEVIVGSRRHMFAGRFDAIREDPARGRGLVDYKTSGDLYLSHHIQLRGYEIGWLECGGYPLDFLELVHLGFDGRYRVEQCKATPQAFLNRLASYRTDRETAAAMKPPKKSRKSRKQAVSA